MRHPALFWQEILEHPEDDGPRLRYAAWLDERCDPLGEFIRIQCRLGQKVAERRCLLELENRERELLAEFETEWVGDIAGMVDFWVFRRGFIHEISATAAQFLEHGEQLFQLAPVEEVHLVRVRDAIDSLADSNILERPTYFDMSNNLLRDHGARRLAASPHLARLRGLNLSSSGVGDSGLKALARSPHLGRLRELYLSDNHIGSPGARALAQSHLVERLNLVHLRFNPIGNDGATLLQERLGSRVCI
ncbi:MAG: TIGR02996 domain-containing protein [Planctomycetes bacterium]|nr:TIGR02996 domain-containing protein [Planctomycetota bacterium]